MASDLPKISVIVPVFNAEEDLSKCVKSVLEQTFVDFELILVNDGSADKSGIICDNFAEQDARVKVFHKINGGVSSARNVGIKNALGNYTIHLDSDDYVESDMLEKLYAATNNETVDMVISNFFIDSKDKITVVKQSIEDNNNFSVINSILGGKIHGSVCNKLIKSDIYMKNQILFAEDISMCEDLLFVVNCLMYISSVVYLDNTFLHYVQREDSTVNSWSEKVFSSYIRVVEELEKLLNSRYERAIINFKINIKKDFLRHSNLSSREFEKIYPEVNKYILSHSYMKFKVKLLLFLVSYGGYTPIKRILNLTKRIYS